MADPRSVRPVRPDERGELARIVAGHWGSAFVSSRGRLHDVTGLPCLVAEDGERWLGLAAYLISGDACELVLLQAFEPGAGIGTLLLRAAEDAALAAGVSRMWLVTTNDNLDALGFYQRRGYRLVAVWPDAVTRARQELKPEIPLLGDGGIVIRDELELERFLAAGVDPSGTEGGGPGAAPPGGGR